MSNPSLRLTADGKNILAKGLIGKEIHFTKVAFGAGEFDYETEKVADLTELKDLKMNLPIVDKKIEGGLVQITALLNNFNLEVGFPAREIGVYALDPDSGEEKLYAYRNAGDEYNFIPGGTGIVKKNARFAYWIEIDDAPNVTFNIDFSFAHVTLQDFEEHLNSEHPHPNTPNHYDDVNFTKNFWVTDFDNDLHKISLDDVKKIVLKEVRANLADEIQKREDLQEFIEAKNELGILEPNILMIENFKPATLIDDFSTQVTSCAKGGNLLSVKSLKGVSVGKEFYITDGVNCEKVIVSGVQISTSKIKINNSNFILILKNELLESYDLENTFLVRTTWTGSKGATPLQSVKWKSRETFSGYPAGVPRDIFMDFSCDNFAAFNISDDGILSAGTLTLIAE